ncbi:hypothetical protein MMC24_001461 [Lignoscripta atroalba]|nr:hypothetical protein [Lignoscripta atroalba]
MDTRSARSLLDLPNELLSFVVEYISPDDIEHFALCCIRIKSLMEGRLREHRKLKFKYSTINCGVNEYGRDGTSGPDPAIQTLLAIGSNPQIRFYFRNLYLHERSMFLRDHHAHRRISDPLHETESSLNQINSISSILTYLDDEACQQWYEEIELGDYDSLIALLLVLCPNIQRLHFYYTHRGLEYLPTIFKKITTRPLRNNQMPPALTELKELLITYEEDHPISNDLNELLPWIMLPAIHSIGLNGVHGFYSLVAHPSQITFSDLERGHAEGDWFSTDTPASRSSVTSVSLARSNIQFESLSAFLSNFRALEEFIYSPMVRADIWDPFAIREILLLHAENTLKRLSLHSSEYEYVKFIGSLQKFKVLQAVHMELNMLVDDHGRMHRLVDILPISIKFLRLNGDTSLTPKHAVALLTDLPQLRDERVPRLQRVVFFYLKECEYIGYNTMNDTRRSLQTALVTLCVPFSKGSLPLCGNRGTSENRGEHRKRRKRGKRGGKKSIDAISGDLLLGVHAYRTRFQYFLPNLHDASRSGSH